MCNPVLTMMLGLSFDLQNNPVLTGICSCEVEQSFLCIMQYSSQNPNYTEFLFWNPVSFQPHGQNAMNSISPNCTLKAKHTYGNIVIEHNHVAWKVSQTENRVLGVLGKVHSSSKMWFQIIYNCLDCSCHFNSLCSPSWDVCSKVTVISCTSFLNILNSRSGMQYTSYKIMSHQRFSFTCFHYKEPFYISLIDSHCSQIATPHCFWNFRWRVFFSEDVWDMFSYLIFTGHGWWPKKKAFPQTQELLERRHSRHVRPWEMGVIPPSKRKAEFTLKSWANLIDTGCILCLILSTDCTKNCIGRL